ncbi:MAG: hypothetical protein FWG79_08765, partial [Bacteroidales bacterium]|nr:hypothetical protein [Bacteroidales bacterium]
QSNKQQLGHYHAQNTIESITQMLPGTLIDSKDKQIYLERLSKLDPTLIESVCESANVKITGMDMKYIICFMANIEVDDISLLFNIEPASVRTVRYRIRKKLAKESFFRSIL